MIGLDNNASYPSPTELTTNATYNMEAEDEYETDKTGKQMLWLLTAAEIYRPLDGRITEWFGIQSSALN